MKISIKTDSKTKSLLYEYLSMHENVKNIIIPDEEYDFIIEAEKHEELIDDITTRFPILYYDLN